MMNEASTMKPESWAWHLLGFIIPLSVIAGNLLGGVWTLSCTVIALVIFPVLDLLSGEAKPARPPRESGFPFEAMLHVHSVLHWGVVGSLLWYALQTGNHWTTWAAMVSTGIGSGVSGIIVAHELGHKRPKSLSWWMGRGNLLLTMYLHFTTEHNHNHHRNVATIECAASAPKGRSFWVQYVMTLPLQLRSAWEIERARAEKKGKSTLFLLNGVFIGLVVQVGLCTLLYLNWGVMVWAAFVYQAAMAIFLLEYVNYIRHYGLRREVGERQTEMHSWQTECRWSRWTLLELTRHPAHHLKASLPFWQLQPYENAPTLPSGYFAMFWPSLLPPLWRKLLDPRIP